MGKKTTEKEPEKTEQSSNGNAIRKEVGRIVAGGYYDYQGIRKSVMNRIRDVVRKVKEGIPFDAVEEKKEEKTYSKDYQDANILKLVETLGKEGLLGEEEEKYLSRAIQTGLIDAAKVERQYMRQMLEYVESVKVYQHFLNHVRGIGAVLSANLIKEFGEDCSRYDTVSALWKHSGNHVTDEGIAPKLRKGQDIDFSPRIRTMTWKISDCLMKSNKGIYRLMYDREKKRQLHLMENELQGAPQSKGHAHNRALRKMRKLFLSHYWSAARELNGLPSRPTYVDGKLHHKKIITWRDAIRKELKKPEDLL